MIPCLFSPNWGFTLITPTIQEFMCSLHKPRLKEKQIFIQNLRIHIKNLNIKDSIPGFDLVLLLLPLPLLLLPLSLILLKKPCSPKNLDETKMSFVFVSCPFSHDFSLVALKSTSIQYCTLTLDIYIMAHL